MLALTYLLLVFRSPFLRAGPEYQKWVRLGGEMTGSYVNSSATVNKNLATADRSRVSCARNTSRATP